MNRVAVSIIVAAVIIAGMMLYLSNRNKEARCEDLLFSDPAAWSLECN